MKPPRGAAARDQENGNKLPRQHPPGDRVRDCDEPDGRRGRRGCVLQLLPPPLAPALSGQKGARADQAQRPKTRLATWNAARIQRQEGGRVTLCASIKKPEALAGALGLPEMSLGRQTQRKML